MAYPYFPNYFNDPQMYQRNNLIMPQAPVNSPTANQIQSAFIPVRSEDEARNYPVAPGNSVILKNEVSPYIYTKTMGFSQLDRPVFEKFKLIKEDAVESRSGDDTTPVVEYATKTELNALKERVESLIKRGGRHDEHEYAETTATT